jgi:hypothetical protein
MALSSQSIITDVNGVAAKITMMHMVAIEWDAIVLVSTRGTVDGHGFITSSARNRAWH